MHQSVTFTLILFRKNRDGDPVLVGAKPLTKPQYDELTDPIFKSMMVGSIQWNIIERRSFHKSDPMFVNFFVVIDGVQELMDEKS